MDKRELAKADWEDGLRASEIAKKHNLNPSTVRSWINRYFKQSDAKKNGAVALQQGDALQQNIKNVATEPNKLVSKQGRGAPIGNQNALGNKGGAPIGNTNAMIHSAYAKKYAGIIDQEKVSQVLEQVGADSEVILENKIIDLQLQENYYITRISKLVQKYKSDMGLKEVSKVTNGYACAVTTKTTSLDNLLNPLYAELTRVQNLMVRTVKELEVIRNNRIKLGISGHIKKLDPFDNLTLEEIKALMIDE